MKKLLFLVLGMLMVLPTLADAHGPSRKKVVKSIEIAASPADVWSVVGDYNGLPAWLPAVKKSSADKGNEVGSLRTLTLGSGGVITETLEKYDGEGMLYSYRIKDVDPKDFPVSNYSSTVSVSDNGNGGTVVKWKGAFYRAYNGNNPPADMSDEAAVKAVSGLYDSGLANLKKTVEGK